ATITASPLVSSVIAVPLLARPHRTETLRAHNAAGDMACVSCHAPQASFEQTAHHLTSTLPTRQSILGSFSRGENVLRTSNPELHFRLDSTATGYYQTAVMGRAPD